MFFFFIRVFFHKHWRFTGQQGKGGDYLLFHSATSTRSRTLRYLFATLHVRWLSRIFIATLVFTRLLIDEIYHLIELPFEWLIDDAIFVCLLDELILGFLLQRFDMRNRWIWTLIDYHPCITSESTNQVWTNGQTINHRNINWKNKNVQRTETQHTNSILVQKCDTMEGLAKINLEPKHDSYR